MKARRVVPGALGLLLWLTLARAAGPAVSQAWIRVLPGDLPLAGYFVLGNPGAEPLTLVGAHSPAFRDVQMHQSRDDSGMARMAAVERLTVAPRKQVTLAPGGYHLMLFGRTRSLQPGGKVSITLDFSDGSHLEVPFELRGASAR